MILWARSFLPKPSVRPRLPPRCTWKPSTWSPWSSITNMPLSPMSATCVRAQAFGQPFTLTVIGVSRSGKRFSSSDGGTLYWSAQARYYDTQGAAARSGTRQLAITRKYARLTPVRLKDRIVYREEPFDGRMNPGDVLTI